MTEKDWLSCMQPRPMLEFLRGKASDRKLRLFAIACCRHFWDQTPADTGRNAVLTAERYADGLASAAERAAAQRRAITADRRKIHQPLSQRPLAVQASVGVLTKDAMHAAIGIALRSKSFLRDTDRGPTALLREIFGNPFRPVALDPSWLAWNDGAFRKLAQAIYDERTFDRLPLLADALEDAGCDNADILSHCRAPGEHVRGCWVVDLLLGKT